MLDRSQPYPFLTLAIHQKALIISAALFAVFPIGWMICMVGGAIGFAACWVWFGIVWLFFFGIVFGSAILVCGLGGAIAYAAKKNGANGGAAWAVVIGIIIGIVIIVNGLEWATENVVPVQNSMRELAMAAWDTCASTADYLLKDLFIGYRIHLWSWAVLAASLAVALGTMGVIAFASSERVLGPLFGRVHFQCPNCSRRESLFRCPRCPTLHDDLVPSRYGVWTAACGNCGAPLGTTAASGKLNLEKVCKCTRDLKHPDLGKLPEFHIAYVGAKNSGKTHLMIAAIEHLETVFASAHDMTITFADRAEDQDYRDRIRQLRAGKRFGQTVRSNRPPALYLSVKQKDSTGFLLYLYDAAGEDIQLGDAAVSGHDFHRIADGIVFVADPFAEPVWRREAERLNGGRLPDGINPAPQDAQYILGRMLPLWLRTQNVAGSGRLRVPVAVVLSKADAYGLDKRFRLAESADTYDTFKDAATAAVEPSDEVRTFLRDTAGAADFIQNIESHFPKVSYFGATALGRLDTTTDTRPFQSRGAFAPVLWLLHETGGLPDGRVVDRRWVNFSQYCARCFRGQEGATARWAVWFALIAGVPGILGTAWLLGGSWAMLGAILVPALIAGVRWGTSTHGRSQLAAFRQVLAQQRVWLHAAVVGKRGGATQGKAFGLLAAGALLLVLGWAIAWPLGVGLTVIYLMVCALSF